MLYKSCWPNHRVFRVKQKLQKKPLVLKFELKHLLIVCSFGSMKVLLVISDQGCHGLHQVKRHTFTAYRLSSARHCFETCILRSFVSFLASRKLHSLKLCITGQHMEVFLTENSAKSTLCFYFDRA